MQKENNISKDDLEVLKFLKKYKLLKVEDASLIYKTKRYYRQRVNKLIDKEYVKRYKSYIMIAKKGRKALGDVGTNYIKNMKNEAYMERLKNIASIATLSIDSNIEFIPSWEIKEKDIYTETARRYIAKAIIDGEEYLTYYISDKKEHVYIKQLLFDINKAINNEKIVIFVENFDVLNKRYSNLAFGKEETYVIQNTSVNKDIIKNINNINVHDLLEKIYEKEILISNWEQADYLLEDGRYILYMPFINTEKLTRINWYYQENTESNRKLEILTLEENEEKIQEIIGEKCRIEVLNKNLLGGICEE